MPRRSFKRFIEQELGKFPEIVIYALLEWILIAILFLDGLLAFFANEFARFFELNIPCLLCTRIDHVLVKRNADFYYNDSICVSHKKNISSLAYCHNHKRISDVKRLCEGCLLSFATEKESDCDTYKSLVGILHKDLELVVDDEQELQVAFPASGFKKDENFIAKRDDRNERCSCCGELLKVRSYKPKSFSSAPSPSPRVSSNLRNSETPNAKFSEMNKFAFNDPEVQDDDEFVNASNRQPDESTEDKTPNFARGGNRFFGVSLSDSSQNTPTFRTHRSFRRDRFNNPSEPSDSASGLLESVSDGDNVLHNLKKQVRLDKKSLLALYMELDEERSASAVAANNAMAMITRLQADKAAVQMEALQYQRMMEEQAEYDQEALQVMKDLVEKREEEIKELETELAEYREEQGIIREEDEEGEEGEEEGGGGGGGGEFLDSESAQEK